MKTQRNFALHSHVACTPWVQERFCIIRGEIREESVYVLLCIYRYV
jgi:hypothetical protein